MIDMTVSTRERIIRAAMDLLATGGREAVSSRAVSAAAGVQPPTIYRQFGDMQGLLDAVASRGFSGYLESKITRVRADDPVEDLRAGWDLHIAFGLANPAIYGLMYGDPRSETQPSAAAEAADILHGLVQRVAEAGRLRVSVDRAAAMIHAAGVGVTLTQLATPPEDRDPSVSNRTREAILAAITTDAAAMASERPDSSRVANHAVALRAVLPERTDALSPGERTLLVEWLDRLSQTGD